MLLFLYNLLLPFFLVVSFPFYLRRMIRRGGYARNFFQRFGFFSHRIKAELSKGGWTWIRAVSVGEVLTTKRSTMRKARIALARRLAIIMHAMLRHGTEFKLA
jgi:3-deoxy-D-manno-octulosonic-acid transferase